VPRHGYYIVEVVYEGAEEHLSVDPSLIAGIDMGLNNQAAVTANTSGFVPRVVNGRPIKSINQWYNKERAKLQAILSKGKRHNSHKLDDSQIGAHVAWIITYIALHVASLTSW
jgi:putative transposase